MLTIIGKHILITLALLVGLQDYFDRFYKIIKLSLNQHTCGMVLNIFPGYMIITIKNRIPNQLCFSTLYMMSQVAYLLRFRYIFYIATSIFSIISIPLIASSLPFQLLQPLRLPLYFRLSCQRVQLLVLSCPLLKPQK